jgi:hypothetical protein
MAQLDVRRLYRSNKILTKGDIDAIVDDLETFFNITKLNNDNLNDAGITASSKLVDESINTAKFSNSSITTAKLADAAVSTAVLEDATVSTGSIIDDAVTTVKLADGAVTADKIASATITKPKIATNYQKSSEINYVTFPIGNTAAVTYTHNSGLISASNVSITTVGNPIKLGLIASPSYGGFLSCVASSPYNGALGALLVIELYRNGVNVNRAVCGFNTTNIIDSTVFEKSSIQKQVIPVGGIQFIDVPAAGTHLYQIQLTAIYTKTQRAILQPALRTAVTFSLTGRLFAYEVP